MGLHIIFLRLAQHCSLTLLEMIPRTLFDEENFLYTLFRTRPLQNGVSKFCCSPMARMISFCKNQSIVFFSSAVLLIFDEGTERNEYHSSFFEVAVATVHRAIHVQKVI